VYDIYVSVMLGMSAAFRSVDGVSFDQRCSTWRLVRLEQ
jgi:hypothetical protein